MIVNVPELMKGYFSTAAVIYLNNEGLLNQIWGEGHVLLN